MLAEDGVAEEGGCGAGPGLARKRDYPSPSPSLLNSLLPLRGETLMRVSGHDLTC